MTRNKLISGLKPILFTLPAMIPFVLFWLAPLIYVLYLSFTEWDFMSPTKTFVGLQNYTDLFGNPAFYKALRVTVLFCIGSVLPVIAIGLGLALLMNRKLTGSGFYQALLFSPWVTPTVAVSIVWSWIYEPEVGLANTVLNSLGLEPIGWLQDPKWALAGVLLVTVWKSAGWAMIFYLVALRNVPSDLLEAGELDGAGAVQTFVRITLPLISPTTLFLFVVQMVQALQAYDQINVLTQGGPSGSTRTLLYLYYQSAFESFQIGEASSVAVVLVFICMLLSVLSLSISRRTTHYQ
ncbi:MULTISPECIES: sugar ABC transporter permease [unclassified Paenibacillus]|uniref:carbohydrate ABC transporter permease n=1 Tax=unclassified Paenibacillus TaxID=185978 RepID=UPI002406233F|nr:MULTISPECIES: sugar ABC transporter permease [unclassified Paenibacillus]MDF9844317.1 multiple sugar transport system permease protein [Paenibacillus sp. PastF-2]MDF9850894.1 multiple sugar transport system permease protein [Paenibacillus sp. PastM-2]MDF9857492.1 multiple sugar transport system permease protein [Paenibacillus sp. PastF-1]MDH6482732.1 multiple sugar transport system permease protein [Paenibacillus sp. PastH-2]MDH6510158.1 multiple sugar transport system permease protein [Pae